MYFCQNKYLKSNRARRFPRPKKYQYVHWLVPNGSYLATGRHVMCWAEVGVFCLFKKNLTVHLANANIVIVFQVDLNQQGELLMQGSFFVASENKRDLRLRIRPRRRHIFLYEKAMLFCKPATKNSHNKATYHFKHDLQVSFFYPSLTRRKEKTTWRQTKGLSNSRVVTYFKSSCYTSKSRRVYAIIRVVLFLHTKCIYTLLLR